MAKDRRAPALAPASDTPPTGETSPEPSEGTSLAAKLQPRYPYQSRELTPEEAEANRRGEETRCRAQTGDRDHGPAEFFLRIGRRYRDCTLENFYSAGDARQRAVVVALRKYVRHLDAEVKAGNGVVLFGPAGTGKDHLLVGLAKEAFRHKLKAGIVWKSAADLFGEFRDAMDNTTSEAELVQRLVSPTILILSDPVPAKGSLTDYQAGTLLRVLDARYRECRPTWASLNVSQGSEADERMGAAAVDRLKHGAIVCHCDWPSYRKPRVIGG